MRARLSVSEAMQAGLLDDPKSLLRISEKPRKRRPNPKSKGEETFALQCQSSEYALPAPPMRQFPFAKPVGRKFTADFAWPAQKLLVEIDGGVWMAGGGAHSHPTNIERDIEKQNLATLLGYSVLRFTPKQVAKGDALAFTVRVLRARVFDLTGKDA